MGGSLWMLLGETRMQTEDRTSHLLYHFPYPSLFTISSVDSVHHYQDCQDAGAFKVAGFYHL